MTPPAVQALTTFGQWLACTHQGTTLLPAGPDPIGVAVVSLAAADPVTPAEPADPAGPRPDPGPAGLAIAADGTLYHGLPERGRVERFRWSPTPGTTPAAGDDVLSTAPPRPAGDFHRASEPPAALRAVAIAVAGLEPADAERLTILDRDGDLVAIDLGSGRLVRRLRWAPDPAAGAPWTPPASDGPLRPVDLAAAPGAVLVACASRTHPLWRVPWHGDPVEVTLPEMTLPAVPAGALPSRVAAAPDGRVWLLWGAPGQPAVAVAVTGEAAGSSSGPLPDATDIELDGTGALVVAAGPGVDLRVYRLAGGSVVQDRPLRAARSDGRGLARTPDGRIAFWTARGLRVAFGAPLIYRADGRLTTTALDSGVFRQRWGRLFLDACIPPGTSVTVSMVTSDDLPGDQFDGTDGFGPLPGEQVTIAHEPPVNITSPPPTDPAVLPLPAPGAGFGPPLGLYRRGPVEQPWVRRAHDDSFVTYEAPVNAAPGRYLWLRLDLRGTPQRAPRVRAMRVRTSGPRLLERLPRVYAEDPATAAFLDRYLQLIDVTMSDAGAAAQDRHVLLDPRSAPPEMLPWLASLVGLVLDGRWPDHVRRTMIAEAVCLFRRRGTVGGLLRMAEILLGVKPVLVERFRFRGRTGTVGVQATRAGSSFADYAHRFSVVVPGAPTAEQLDMLGDLLDLHRPAHTIFEICSARTGSRVGMGMHLDLTAVIGRRAGFADVTVGGALGRGGVLGHRVGRGPAGGLRVGSGGLGRDARVEP